MLCCYCRFRRRTSPVPSQVGRQDEGAYQVVGEGMQQEDAAYLGRPAYPQPRQAALAGLGVDASAVAARSW